MWKIGDIEVDGRVVLAPMSGVTSYGYREFMKPFGVAVCVSEMTSASGIIHGLGKTMEYTRFGPNYPTGLQLFGGDPEIIAKAAEFILKKNSNIDFFDVNMGCPAGKVTRSGSGSSMMTDPKKCGDVIRRIKERVNVPVTAKIRLGIDSESINFREVIDELTDADVDAIAVHARTKDERYAGVPHYNLIEDLQSKMSVPLIVSGNIYSLEDAIYATDITGAAAVMVARGGVGDPFLVTQIDHYFRTGETLPNPTISQQIDWCIRLAGMIMGEKGEEQAVSRLRSFAPKFISGCHRCREYRRKLAVETDSYEKLVVLLEEIREKMGSETIYADGRKYQKDGITDAGTE